MRQLVTFLTALALGISAAFAVGVDSAAAEGPDGVGTTLKLEASAVSTSAGRHVLRATLSNTAGAPLGEQTVSFYQAVDLIGARSALVGTAMTDSAGVATLSFVATQTGAQSFSARFAGAKGFAKSDASTQIQVTRAKAAFEQPASPYGVVGQLLPYALGVLVLGVWVLLAGLLLTTIAGIRSAARPRRTGARRVLNPMSPQPGEVGGGT